MWIALSTLHKDGQREWRMKTDGRPSDTENHGDFESRDLENFIRCNEELGPMLA